MSTDIERAQAELARDLALFNADALSIEEVAARARCSVDAVISQLDNPALLALAEREAVAGRLSGSIAQAKAAAIRDRALSLLAQRLDGATPTRVLLDTLTVVRPIAAKEDSKQQGTGFQLNIVFSGDKTQAISGDVVDVAARELKGEA